MWGLKLCVFVLCVLCTSGSYFPRKQFPPYLPRITTPEDLGQHLLNHLARNESRVLSTQCSTHLVQYAKGLIRLKIWAIKMFDASAKFPAGFLRGHGGALGSFDECLSVASKNETVGIIRGKYCLGQLILVGRNRTSRNEVEAERAEELLVDLEHRILDIRHKTMGLAWGVCLPEACSAEDFKSLHLNLLSFSEDECQTKANQSKELDNSDIGAIAFLGVIAALIILSTTYDVYGYYKWKDRGSLLLRSFSVVTNGSKIITISDNNQDLSCLHGIRALTLLIFTAGYRFGLHIFAPLNNWLDMAMWIYNTVGFFEAVVIADTFFVVSGMLVSYNYLKSRAAGVKFNLFIFYLNRIIRLTPPLAAIIFIHATLLRHMGSGPVWPRTRDLLLVKGCRKYWWSALLYVQNYVNPGFAELCILPTWQLSADMQMFILSPLVLIPLTRAPKFTLGFVGLALFGGILAPFLTAWFYQLKSVIVTFRSVQDIRGYFYFFFPTHTRAAAWIIGFILGYVIFETKKKPLRVPVRKEILSIIVILLWATSLAALVMCIAIGSEIIGREYKWVPHAFHMALIRPVWAIAISWIIFACVHGYGGYINSILSVPVFQIISRISYSTFLVNYTVMLLLTYQTREGLEFSNANSLKKFCSDVLLSLASGFVWNLAFESPFITIANIMFRKLAGKKIKV